MKATLSQKATLSCNVSDSKTEVKWYKDGKLLISSRTIYSEAKDNTRQLVIEKVEKNDAGEYTCQAGGDKLVFKIFVSGRTECPFLINYMHTITVCVCELLESVSYNTFSYFCTIYIFIFK